MPLCPCFPPSQPHPFVPPFQNSQLFNSVSSKGKEEGNEFTGRSKLVKHPSRTNVEAAAIAEGDEEEEGDE